MSNLKQHAEIELKASGFLSKESDYNGMIGEAVLELIELFAKQGHSGLSASITSNLFNKLSRYEPLGPLTGDDEEWGEASSNESWQNKRCSAVFKDKDGRCTYVDDVIKRTQSGTTWHGPLYLTREDAINSVNLIDFEIKGFPFTPKTFYIDVIEEEIAKDDWIMWVKDPSQLDEVREYYNQTQTLNK